MPQQLSPLELAIVALMREHVEHDNLLRAAWLGSNTKYIIAAAGPAGSKARELFLEILAKADDAYYAHRMMSDD